MTDQTIGEQLVGGAGEGQPAVSPNEAVSSTSMDATKMLAELAKRLEKLERGEQSVKDKGLFEANKRMDSFDERLARYDALLKRGMDPEDAKYRMAVEDMLAERGSVPQTTPGSGAALREQGSSIDVDKVLQATGLSVDDPLVSQAVRLNDVNALLELAVSRRNAPQPTPAAILPTGGGSSVPVETQETLTEQLLKLQQNPSQNWNKIMEVSAKLKALLPTSS